MGLRTQRGTWYLERDSELVARLGTLGLAVGLGGRLRRIGPTAKAQEGTWSSKKKCLMKVA